MDKLDILNSILKIFVINILTDFVFVKLINYTEKDKTKIIINLVINIILTIAGWILIRYMRELYAMIIIYFIKGISISKIIKKKIEYTTTVTFISLVIVYSIHVVSIILTGIITKIFIANIKYNNSINLVIIIIIEIAIIKCFFKIKRFKKGITFLQNKERTGTLGVIGVVFCGIVMVIFSLVDISKGKQLRNYLMIGILIEAICLTIWIRKRITKYYKQKMKEKTIEELENEIKAKEEEIIKITEENKAIATINHKYSNRIKALEKFSAEILERPKLIANMKEEFGTEFGDIQETIKKLSEEFTSEMNDKVKTTNKLAKTNIFGIDNILEYMKNEAEKNDIKFDLKINASINYMIENIINQNKLETLLGDHIKDAIIAINHSENTYKSILVIIGIIDDCYEICIYDTGIEFEIETLIKLGTEAITTHKETGGSGIGFMTTFETLKETKASLIIEEKHPMNNKDYTKAVKIRFDGKNEYRIESYREEEIKKQDKEKRIYFL